MKKLLFACVATFSLSAFSQSYLIMDNGIIITADRSGFVYDFGHYAYPQKITLKGGQYFVEDKGVLATVDENGLLYRKYEVIPEKILGKGINYFLSTDGALFTIDRKGAVKITEDETLKRATNFGGNFFLVTTDDVEKLADLYTINVDGQLTKAITSLKLTDIMGIGGSYFMNNRGVLHTISDAGQVMPQANMRIGLLNKKGGNYFTDSSGILYTVASDGTVRMPGLPMSLKVNTITKLASTYFLDLSGKLFVVDRNGDVFERAMRDHDFKEARIISL